MKIVILFSILFFGLSVQSNFIRSDLTLLSGLTPEEDPIDPNWNLAWHTKAAAYGDPTSLFFMAQVYEQGKLVPRDLKKAIMYYQKAAGRGHLESCAHLARLLPQEAIHWYTVAAYQEDPQAQLKLSELYEAEGNYSQAIFWREKALHLLFPDETDLTKVSPDLARLKALL